MKYPNTKILTKEELLSLKLKDMQQHERTGSNLYLPRKQNWFSAKKKEIQRTLNYHVRECNETIKNDYLWRSRFFVRQVGYPVFYKFEDGSGGELFVTLRFYDKKTMKYIDSYGSAAQFCFGWSSVYWLMNKAITEIFCVWDFEKDDPNSPYNDLTDYTSIPNEWTIKNSSPVNENYNYFRNN